MHDQLFEVDDGPEHWIEKVHCSGMWPLT